MLRRSELWISRQCLVRRSTQNARTLNTAYDQLATHGWCDRLGPYQAPGAGRQGKVRQAVCLIAASPPVTAAYPPTPFATRGAWGATTLKFPTGDHEIRLHDARRTASSAWHSTAVEIMLPDWRQVCERLPRPAHGRGANEASQQTPSR